MKQRKIKVTKRYYAISIQSYKTVAQSDNLESLIKRCKQIANDFKDGNQTFNTWDSQYYPAVKGWMGFVDQYGWHKF